MTKEDLKNIYIRAYTDKWESVSLQDLIDRGYGNEISKWFMSKLARLDEQEVITEDMAVLMVSYLESAGIPIVRLNRPDETREEGRKKDRIKTAVKETTGEDVEDVLGNGYEEYSAMNEPKTTSRDIEELKKDGWETGCDDPNCACRKISFTEYEEGWNDAIDAVIEYPSSDEKDSEEGNGLPSSNETREDKWRSQGFIERRER